MNTIRFACQGAIALILMTANTIILTMVIFIFALIKLILPQGRARHIVSHGLSSIGELWISINSTVLWFYRGMEWDVELPDGLDREGHYLVFSNHQSWVDILVLQRCLNRRAPFMRFLLKQTLIWVPFLGAAWWGLDMVFLRRYTKKQILKNPALKNRNLENAARACEKLKHIPVSMMAFPEGTRFTREKHRRQQSPYDYLLLPRFRGIGQILYSFDHSLGEVIDVTIFYPGGVPTFWQFVSGQVSKISVRVDLKPIDDGLMGKNFREDAEAELQLETWLNGIWEENDGQLGVMVKAELAEKS
jgi:1-acyl-sn-glycerol-3-phosphate acyltransferase